MQRATAEIVIDDGRYFYRIDSGDYAGIFFAVPRDHTYRCRGRIGETVRVQFHPDDQFAHEIEGDGHA